MTPSNLTQQMLRVRNGATAVFLILAVAGQAWGDQPAEPVTRAVAGLAGAICPGQRRPASEAITVADSAHALDRAVLTRLVDALAATSRCRRTSVATTR